MFIVNQDGERCEKLEKIYYTLDWSDDVSSSLKEIYDRIYPKAYNYGSTAKCLNMIEYLQNDYIIKHNCKKVVRIYVNGIEFAVYDDVEKGKKIFKDILYNLSYGTKILNLANENGEL